MPEEVFNADFGDGPPKPQNRKGESHRTCQIKIGIGATEEGLIAIVWVNPVTRKLPTDSSDSWHKAKPVREKNQNENRSKKPEGLHCQFVAEDPFKKAKQ